MEAELSSEFVFVEVGGKRYGLPASSVREVFQMLEPTPVPAWPEHAIGLMDVRGELVPLIDCAPLLGQPLLELSKDQFIVVLLTGKRPWGLVVDAVEGVRTVQIHSGKEFGAAEAVPIPSLCLGLHADSGGVTIVLDPERLYEAIRLPSSPQRTEPGTHGHEHS